MALPEHPPVVRQSFFVEHLTVLKGLLKKGLPRPKNKDSRHEFGSNS